MYFLQNGPISTFIVTLSVDVLYCLDTDELWFMLIAVLLPQKHTLVPIYSIVISAHTDDELMTLIK